MKILVTGSAGFIGFHLTGRLLAAGYEVTGVDNINDYYDVTLKYNRLAQHGIAKEHIEWNVPVVSASHPNYRFIQLDIAEPQPMQALFVGGSFDVVVNLAAQAGVRYSLINPYVYTHSNVNGFLNVLEGCRATGVKHLVYASTSSVYGLNADMPLSVHQPTEHPISLYAATKKANEMMAHSYSHLFGLPTTGIRFFTVYGPWGRPDMALFLFTKAILSDKPIQVFNNGDMIRDFTYVDDIVAGINSIIERPPVANPGWNAVTPDSATSSAPYKIVNIGNSHPVKLIDYIEALEKALGKTAIKQMMPMQPGDVSATHADVKELVEEYGYQPSIDVNEGVRRFVSWYKEYFK
ncbi:NAD-dependent epimerase [Deminuibacter soli]|uniref:NAD-dependent epimerase n=1 Tax=Deminuibacter soli TaxID=2291815 RepID=A0A3E1NKM7_9BACT|nr:NAD-dependent epimerase [Deminuibacter soli]RFM28441.1 NAD-dependent epimerase [Deminuibacter soli]